MLKNYLYSLFLWCVFLIGYTLQIPCYCTVQDNTPVFENADVESNIRILVPLHTCFVGFIENDWLTIQGEKVRIVYI